MPLHALLSATLLRGTLAMSALLGLALAMPTPASAQFKFRPDFEATIGSFYAGADGSISSGADRVGYEDDLGFDDDFLAIGSLRWAPGVRWLPGLGFNYSELYGEGSRVADSNFELLGVETQAGVSGLGSVLDLDVVDVYGFYPFELLGFNVQAGVGGRFYDGIFAIVENGAEANPQSAQTDLGTSTAVAHAWVQRDLLSWLTVGGRVTGTPEEDHQTLDTEAWAQITPGFFKSVSLRGGYRYHYLNLKDEPGIEYDAAFQGPFVSLVGRLFNGIQPMPGDGDHDGVLDPRDRCPATPFGAMVDDFGCQADADGDTVADAYDQCPGTPPGVAVDDSGCVLDADADGVPDGQDQCPDTPPGYAVGANGCPLDSDGDGVLDALDACPTTAPGVIVNDRGCPLDSDNDGVVDAQDRCPNTPPGVAVTQDGCAADADGDGVTDDKDACPGTLPGLEVGPDGCVLLKEQETVLPDVNFEFNSARLTENGRTVMRLVVTALDNQPGLRIEIQGHTDNVGSASYNLQLSERRAVSVRTFLQRSGIDADRMQSNGYGEALPIADNDTEAGRAQNRRVVIKVLEGSVGVVELPGQDISDDAVLAQ